MDGGNEGRKGGRREGRERGRVEGRKAGRQEGRMGEEGRREDRKEGMKTGRKEGRMCGAAVFWRWLTAVYGVARRVCCDRFVGIRFSDLFLM